MTLLVVRHRCWVTRGAVTWVPISGVMGAGIAGQVTSRANVATGADRSEPSGTWRPAPVSTVRYPGAAGAGGVPGVPVVPASTRDTRTTPVRTGAYTGVSLRPG